MLRQSVAKWVLAVIAVCSASFLLPGVDALHAGVVSYNLTVTNKTLAAVADGKVYITSLQYTFGGFAAHLEVRNAAIGVTLWTWENFGEVEIPPVVYVFPTVPGMVFVTQFNNPPTQLLALHSANGTLAWAITNASLMTLQSVSTTADGQYIVLYQTAPSVGTMATLVTASTGAVASSTVILVPSANTLALLECGSDAAPCFASAISSYSSSGAYQTTLSLVHGLSGAVLWSFTVPQFAALRFKGFRDFVLVYYSAQSQFFRLDTTTFTTRWNNTGAPVNLNYQIDGPSFFPFTGSTGKTSLAWVSLNYLGLLVIDTDTGIQLSQATANTVCPTTPPAPGSQPSLDSVRLSTYPSARPGMFAATVSCEYYSAPNVHIFAAFSVANATEPVWWRYTSAASNNAFVPLDDSYFGVQNQYETGLTSTADIYNAKTMTPKTRYSWTTQKGYYGQPLMLWSAGSSAVLQENIITADGTVTGFYLAGLT